MKILLFLSILAVILCFVVVLYLELPGFLGYCFGLLSGSLIGLWGSLIRELQR